MSGILIVEDDPLLRFNLLEMLDEAGLAAFQASDAEEALRVLKSQAGEVAVLFTDIRMPGKFDGLELARIAQRNWPWLRIVITSGEHHPAEEAMPPNSRFLAKPCTLLEVVTHVVTAVREFSNFQVVWKAYAPA